LGKKSLKNVLGNENFAVGEVPTSASKGSRGGKSRAPAEPAETLIIKKASLGEVAFGVTGRKPFTKDRKKKKDRARGDRRKRWVLRPSFGAKRAPKESFLVEKKKKAGATFSGGRKKSQKACTRLLCQTNKKHSNRDQEKT